MRKHHWMKRGAAVIFGTFVFMMTLFTFADRIHAKDEMPDNGLPVVYINIDESEGTIADMIASPDHSVYCYGTVSIHVPEGFHYSDYPGLDLRNYENLSMSLRGRGNSTWNLSDKKPFKIKLDKKEDIFGFGKNKHWVLLANALDPSLIRNRVTYWLSERLGFEFTPEGVPVDLVMKGDQFGEKYLGSYYLAENIRVDENRLEIDELEEDDVDLPDITGGYLIQNALQVPEGSFDRFNTKRGEAWATDTPSFDILDDGYENEAQKNYIREHLDKVEDVIYEGTEAYREYIDVSSAANYWLINTLSLNLDAYKTSSTYIYKKRDTENAVGKICWGPVWDFDQAYDESIEYDRLSSGHSWMKPLFTDKTEGGFIEEVKKQWPKLRDDALCAIAEGGLIDQYYEETRRSAENDHLINGSSEETEYSYRENIETMKTWLRNRIEWLDENLDSIDDLVHTLTFTIDGEAAGKDFCEGDDTILIHIPEPEKEGYIFMGWQDEEGNIWNYEVSANHDMTLSAYFIPESEATQGEDIIFAKPYDAIVYNPENTLYIMDWVVLPYDTYDKTVEWASSDESIASVDDGGNVEIHGPGIVTITASLHNGVSRDFTLIISEEQIPQPKAIYAQNDVINLSVGETAHILMKTDPAVAKIDDFAFDSEDYDIADVDFYGIVKAVNEGTVRILVQSHTYSPQDTLTLETCVTVIVTGKKESAEYTVVSGNDSEWRKGSKEDLTLTVKRSEEDETCFSHFQGVQIDGTDLLKDNDYTAKAGSTVISLKAAALEKLSEGEHVITVMFDDGKAETKLTVSAKEGKPADQTPDTGDHTSAGMWTALIAVSLLIFVSALKQKIHLR